MKPGDTKFDVVVECVGSLRVPMIYTCVAVESDDGDGVEWDRTSLLRRGHTFRFTSEALEWGLGFIAGLESAIVDTPSEQVVDVLSDNPALVADALRGCYWSAARGLVSLGCADSDDRLKAAMAGLVDGACNRTSAGRIAMTAARRCVPKMRMNLVDALRAADVTSPSALCTENGIGAELLSMGLLEEAERATSVLLAPLGCLLLTYLDYHSVEIPEVRDAG